MQPARREARLPVCLIEENRLAAEYVLQVLGKDPEITPLLFEDISKEHIKLTSLIFVFDNYAPSLPITECLRRLVPRYPGARYVVLGKGKSNEEIVRMLHFGVHAFLDHCEVAQSLVRAVHAVSKGHIWASPEVLQMYVRFTASANHLRPKGVEATTQRETEIIELVKRRLSNKEIAAILNIEESTVKFHLSNIFAKLQVASRYELANEHGSVDVLTRMLAAKPFPV